MLDNDGKRQSELYFRTSGLWLIADAVQSRCRSAGGTFWVKLARRKTLQ